MNTRRRNRASCTTSFFRHAFCRPFPAFCVVEPAVLPFRQVAVHMRTRVLLLEFALFCLFTFCLLLLLLKIFFTHLAGHFHCLACHVCVCVCVCVCVWGQSQVSRATPPDILYEKTLSTFHPRVSASWAGVSALALSDSSRQRCRGRASTLPRPAVFSRLHREQRAIPPKRWAPPPPTPFRTEFPHTRTRTRTRPFSLFLQLG